MASAARLSVLPRCVHHVGRFPPPGEGLSKEGVAAFFTPAKWFSRVLMNAPAQGTIPWFYNQVLPIGERPFITMMQSLRELTRVRA